MTWTPDVPADFAGETAKIRWRALEYLKGQGIDVGCGPWKVIPSAIGVDGSPANGAGGPSLVLDCRDLSIFNADRFDYVFSSHYLEHVHDTLAQLTEFWRVLKPGGHLVLYLPHKDHYPNIGQYGANPDHKHDFVPNDILGYMRRMKGGWDLLENEERAGGYEYSFFQVWRKRRDGLQTYPCKQPKPEKTAAIARPGNFGDAIWATSIAHQLKQQGYHVTAYVEATGAHVMQHHPDIDKIVEFNRGMFYTPQAMFEYIDSQRERFDKFVNLTQTVEATLLLTPDLCAYQWPKENREKQCGRNYVEFMHEVAGVPYVLQQRVHSTDGEMRWAADERRKYKGRAIVLANTGSTVPKWWPYGPAFCQIMAALGVHVFVVGELKGLHYTESEFTHVIPMDKWSVRQAVAFAKVCDAVVGQETGLLNAVACEAVPKVVMLGHSSIENLTRDWAACESLAGKVACYPCHQIHYTHKFCPQEERSKAAACQAAIKIEDVVEALIRLGALTVADRETLMKPQPVTLHRKAA